MGEVLPRRGVFIVGVARSGTTLLRSLLDAHTGTYVIPEETFVGEWHDASDPVAALFDDRPYGKLFPEGTEDRLAVETALRAQLTGPTDVRTALLALLQILLDYAPPPEPPELWVEKTPKHLLRLGALFDAFGDETRAICLVRDPRAVVASQNKFLDRDEAGDLRRFARQWATSDMLIRHHCARRPEQVLAVRYEDLVLEPERAMRAILRHLDLEWADAVLEPTSTRARWGHVSRGGEAHHKIQADSLKRYREELQPRTLRRLERLLAPRMLAWGYELEHPTTRRFSLARASMEKTARRKALAADPSASLDAPTRHA